MKEKIMISQYIALLKKLPFVRWIFRVKGALAPAYEDAKRPLDAWKNGAVDDDVLEEHVEQGGWLGLCLKEGYIVVDIDDTTKTNSGVEFCRRYGLPYMTTRRGIQIFFSLSPQLPVPNQSAMGDHIDLRIGGKGYIVAPSSIEDQQYADERFGRRVFHNGTVRNAPAVVQLMKLNGRNFSEGSRNNTLFSIGRGLRQALRLKNIDYETEIEYSLRFINIFCEPPLPETEIGNLIRHVIEYEDEDNFGDPLEPRTNPFLDFVDIREAVAKDGLKPVFWDGVCRFGDVVLVAAAPKAGKSTLVRSLALACSNNESFVELPQGLVLWYALEETPSQLYMAIADKNIDNLRFCFTDTNRVNNPLLQFVDGLVSLLEHMDEPPVMIVVDTIGRLLQNIDINDYNQIQTAIERIRWAVRRHKRPPVVVLVHHTNKSTERSPLGSQAFSASADVIITLETDERATVMKIIGRGVDPKYQSIELQFDYEKQLYISTSQDRSPRVKQLLRSLSEKDISVEEAEEIAGKAIVRRLEREGAIFRLNGCYRLNGVWKKLKYYLDTETPLGPERSRDRLMPVLNNAAEEGEHIIECCPDMSAMGSFNGHLSGQHSVYEVNEMNEVSNVSSLIKQKIETAPKDIVYVQTTEELQKALVSLFGELADKVKLEIAHELEYNILLPKGWGVLSDLLPFADDTVREMENVSFEPIQDMLEVTNNDSVTDTLNKLYTMGKKIVRFNYFGEQMVAFVSSADGSPKWYVAYDRDGVSLERLRFELIGVVRRGESLSVPKSEEKLSVWCDIDGTLYWLPIVISSSLEKEVKAWTPRSG